MSGGGGSWDVLMPQRRVIKQTELFPCSKVCFALWCHGMRDVSVDAHESPETHMYVDSIYSSFKEQTRPGGQTFIPFGCFDRKPALKWCYYMLSPRGCCACSRPKSIFSLLCIYWYIWLHFKHKCKYSNIHSVSCCTWLQLWSNWVWVDIELKVWVFLCFA